MEVNDYEYRFKDVIDLDTREVLFTVEHEITQPDPSDVRPRRWSTAIRRRPTATTSPATTS